ncbi:endonuclease/exonuclease/phosphatase family protein [Streptomyces sp. S.PNR 29]|uniref:endonuclease/exonuclease/phosphatase family protein n=1 Tax=Streptomyces sp. S.PNR 29 TaxID=2973805 RepID=UPI0025AF61DF|nr:endonuclease/exonuclease/phosphatase family protein [Streptomyces sp. S.PNR 29]MDN0196472.1 endonuclease/exonuclease/phosphatase family protein [Streptomyces sp. S.PNR 29]
MPDANRMTRRMGLRTALAAAATVPLIGTVPASAAKHSSHRLHVMTFNLRFASAAEPNSWAVRRPVMRELLRREEPDVIGTQEGLYQQLRDIRADLGPHYDWIGTGREGGSRDEAVAIFYDTRRLAPVEHDTFWLSDTPRVIGSNTWGGSLPRIATWVRFRDLRGGGREFHLLNTHLDHASQYARARAASLIVERITEPGSSVPFVVTGDFNAAAHKNPVHDTLLAAGLVDTWDTAAERGKLYATFHGYQPLTPDGDRIDWILTTPGVRTHRASINTFSRGGQFPSDHLPVQASLTLG